MSDDSSEDFEIPLVTSFAPGGLSRLETDFEVLASLGVGAFGDVLKVKNKLDSKLYAIKRIPLNPRSEGFGKKIKGEVTLLSRLNHEHVVRYYNSWIEDSNDEVDSDSSIATTPTANSLTLPVTDLDVDLSGSDHDDSENDKDDEGDQEDIDTVGDVSETLYITESSDGIVFEEPSGIASTSGQLLTGEESCRERRNPRFPDNAYKQYLYIQKMIHRDLKPVNIFLDSFDHVKIGDFGLATANVVSKEFVLTLQVTGQTKSSPVTQPYWSESGASDGNLTSQSDVGTFLYCSPEIMTDSHTAVYDQKVDIYSLGLVFFEMSYSPIKTETERISIFTAIKQKDVIFPEDFEGNIQAKAVKRLLTYRPEDRPTMREFMQSGILPPQRIEDREVEKVIRSVISNTQGTAYHSMVRDILAQPSKPTDFTYDKKTTKTSEQTSFLRNQIQDVMTRIFQRHRAKGIPTPILLPKCDLLDGDNQQVLLMDHGGGVVGLQYDHKFPSASDVHVQVCAVGSRPMHHELLLLVKELWSAELRAEVVYDTIPTNPEMNVTISRASKQQISHLVVLRDDAPQTVEVIPLGKQSSNATDVPMVELVNYLLGEQNARKRQESDQWKRTSTQQKRCQTCKNDRDTLHSLKRRLEIAADNNSTDEQVISELAAIVRILRDTRDKNSELAIYYQKSLLDVSIVEKLMYILRLFSENEYVLSTCFQALAEISYGLKTAQECIWKNRGVDLVIDAMKSHPMSLDLQEQAMDALGNISFDQTNIMKHIQQRSGVQLVLDIIAKYLTCPSLLAKSLLLLKNICISMPEIQADIAKKGGIQLALRVMKVHTDSEEVQHSCCAFFTHVCFTQDEICQLAKDKGVVGLVLSALNRFPASVRVQSRGFESVSVLAYGSPELCQYIFDKQAVDLAMSVLQNLTELTDVFISICKAFAVLCFQMPDIQKSIVEKGMLDFSMEFTRNNTHHTGAQVIFCKLIGHLCYNAPSIQEQLAKHNAVDYVITVLENHGDRVECASSAVMTLNCLNLNREQISGMESRIINAITKQIQNIAFDEKRVDCCLSLRMRAFSLLCYLCTDNAKMQRVIVENNDIIALALSAMRQYKRSEEVQRSCCAFFSALCFVCTDIKQAVDLVLLAMAEFPTSVRMQSGGFGALANFAYRCHDVCQYVFDKNIVDFAMTALGEFPEESDVFVAICKAFSNVCFDRPDIKQSIVDQGMLEFVMSFARTHADHTRAQIKFIVLIRALCFDTPSIRTRFAESGAVEHILSVLEKHNHNVDCVRSGLGALCAVNPSREHIRDMKTRFVDVVCSALDAHMDCSVIVAKAFSVCKVYSEIMSEIFTEVVEKNGISIALSAMKKHRYSEEVQHSCCSFFACSGFREPDVRQAAIYQGAVDLVISALSRFEDSVVVQSIGFETLSDLAYSCPDVCCHIFEENIVGLAMSSLRKFPNITVVFVSICKAFAVLCFKVPHIQVHIAESDMVKFGLEFAKNHADNNVVQARFCDLVTKLCSEQPSIQTKLAECNLLEHMVSLIEPHNENTCSVVRALKALDALDASRHYVHDMEIRVTNVVFTAIRERMRIPKLKEHCEPILENAFLFLSPRRKNIADIQTDENDQEVLDLVLSALIGFPKSARLQSKGFETLSVFTFRSSNACQYIFEKHAVNLAMLALETHPDRTAVFVSVCKTFCAMCFSNREIQNCIAHTGILDRGIMFSKENADHIVIKVTFCKLIARLCFKFPNLQAHLANSGAPDYIISVAETHKDHFACVESASRALEAVYFGKQAIDRVKARAAGAAFSVIESHRENHRQVVSALSLLRCVMTGTELIKAARQRLIHEIIQLHGNDPKVRKLTRYFHFLRA